MVQATWNGAVIAESAKTIVVEGNHYFPPDAVRQPFLRPSATTTRCHWKGEASYYSLQVGSEVNEDAAWFYAAPMAEAEALGIKDHVAFWKGVRVQ